MPVRQALWHQALQGLWRQHMAWSQLGPPVLNISSWLAVLQPVAPQGRCEYFIRPHTITLLRGFGLLALDKQEVGKSIPRSQSHFIFLLLMQNFLFKLHRYGSKSFWFEKGARFDNKKKVRIWAIVFSSKKVRDWAKKSAELGTSLLRMLLQCMLV